MYRTLRLALLSFATILVTSAVSSRAADPSPTANPDWKTKPLRQWNAEDAKRVLADSPWIKFSTPEHVRGLSPAERRDSGDWNADIGPGAGAFALSLGIFGTGAFGPDKPVAAIEHAHARPPAGALLIRWESALPVRTAEQKTGETEVPNLDSDDYAIAVYDVPTPARWSLARELKGIAFIRRHDKKDIRPSRVRILRHADNTATLVYLFPRSAEITRKDGWLAFAAQVGPLVVSQNFYAEEMQLQSELQLLMPSDGVR
jgi:hypothetical protein